MSRPLITFNPMRDIKEFHEKFGLEYNGKPRFLPKELAEFRKKFLEEETKEWALSHIIGEVEIPGTNAYLEALEGAFDGLIDLLYVAFGTLYLQGFPVEEGWRRVHRANMQKIRAEAKEQSSRDHRFDVIKPPGWVAPSHRDLVEDFEV